VGAARAGGEPHDHEGVAHALVTRPVEEVDRSAVRFRHLLDDPDTEPTLKRSQIGDELPEVGVVGASVLVLDDDGKTLVGTVVGRRHDVGSERLHTGLAGDQTDVIEAERLTEKVEVVSEPDREIALLVRQHAGSWDPLDLTDEARRHASSLPRLRSERAAFQGWCSSQAADPAPLEGRFFDQPAARRAAWKTSSGSGVRSFQVMAIGRFPVADSRSPWPMNRYGSVRSNRMNSRIRELRST
jgi:hypothetical protein